MKQLSKNFKRKEFECGCNCGFDTVDYELLCLLEEIREEFNFLYRKVFIEITSACRCEKHNKKIGGSQNSQHLRGRASDFKVWRYFNKNKIRQVPPKEVYDFINNKYPDKYGLGKYETFTHLDTRNKKARW